MTDEPAQGGGLLQERDLVTLVGRIAATDDIDAAFDLLCGTVVAGGSWQRAYYAALLPSSNLAFGAAGIEPEERAALRTVQARYGPLERSDSRRRLLQMHRLAPDLDVCFVPAGLRAGLPDEILGGPAGSQELEGRWEAGDDLVLVPHDHSGRPLGMLALSGPRDGRRPTDADLPELRALLALVAAGAAVILAKEDALERGRSESRDILAYVASMTGAAERQDMLDRIAEQCARIARYQRSVLTVHLDDGPMVGAWNITADQRQGFLDAATATTPERVAERRRAIRAYAFEGTGICYIPHDADVSRSSGFVRGPADVVGSWHPADRLILLVQAQPGEEFGTLSLDMPEHGTVPTQDRLGPLRVAESFLHLGATLLRARMLDAHLVRSNRLEALGTLAAGVAHDFNNIIGVMLGYASLLRMKVEGDENLVRMTGAIEEAAQRAAALTGRLRGLTRGGRGEPRPVDVASLLEDCARVARETFDRRIEIVSDIPEDLPQVAGDVAQLYRCLMNVCVNARDALPEGGRIEMRMRAEQGPSVIGGDTDHLWVHVVVDDDGPGIDASLADRVFEPFFTTKARSDNRGLGLFTAYNVIRAHEGTIQIAPSPLGGTRVRILLPALEIDPDEDGRGDPKDRRALLSDYDEPIAPAHVLIVEDEEPLQHLMVAGLELLGHSADVVGDGDAAVEQLTRSAGAYDLVVLDLVLPKRSGLDVFRHLQRIKPDLAVLLSSGNVEEGLSHADLLEKVTGVLQKPWRMEDFQDAVQHVLRVKQEGAAG